MEYVITKDCNATNNVGQILRMMAIGEEVGAPLQTNEFAVECNVMQSPTMVVPLYVSAWIPKDCVAHK